MNYPEVLLLVKDTNLYFFPYIESCDVESVFEGGKKIADILLEAEAQQPGTITAEHFGTWKYNLASYKYVIFFDFGFTPLVSEYVRDNSNASKILYLWNSVDEEKLAFLEDVYRSNSIDEIYSFDPIDAALHGLKHNSTFYQPLHKEQPQNMKHDIFFGGKNKGRADLLLELQEQFDAKGITFLLHCPEIAESMTDNYLTYNDYLSYVLENKVILEILKDGQNGVSLRTMESLHYHKKMITNNQSIQYYNFYTPENIFILGVDDFKTIQDFIHSPYAPLERSLVDFFTVDAWIQRFIDDIERTHPTFELTA